MTDDRYEDYDTREDEDVLDEQYAQGDYAAAPPPQVRKVPRPQAPQRAERLPVGDIETAETLTGLVKITRSLSLGSRNDQVHMGIEQPFPIQPGWSPERCASAAADAFASAKSVLYEQLGVDFTVDEGGIVREVIRHQFPGTREERSPARSEDRGTGGGGSGGGSRYTPPREMDKPDHVKRDDWDDLVSNPDDWFDNRPDKASGQYKDTAPDFKRKGRGDQPAIWLRALRPAGRSHGGGGNRRGYDD